MFYRTARMGCSADGVGTSFWCLQRNGEKELRGLETQQLRLTGFTSCVNSVTTDRRGVLLGDVCRSI